MQKVISASLQVLGTISASAFGAAIPCARGKNLSVQCNITASTPTGSVQLQKSNDNVIWTNDGSSIAVTATGTYWLEKIGITSAFMRVSYVISAGSYSSQSYTFMNGDVN